MRMSTFAACFVCLAVVAGCQRSAQSREALTSAPAGLAVATFAGGCFWCMEAPFDAVVGVISTTSGYAGGPETGPTYEQVAMGNTGHAEAVRVVYDPKKVDYATLLQVFWHNIDPMQKDGQFCDRGRQYRTAIFTHDEAQKSAAEASRVALQKSGALAGPIATEIVSAGSFWSAEDYHQDYYKKNPGHYGRYRAGCGRDRRLKQIWGASAGH